MSPYPTFRLSTGRVALCGIVEHHYKILENDSNR